jgi:ADP-ribosylglycohydrolase
VNTLQDKAIGALMAAAVGDAIGGATEGRSAEEIVERYRGHVEGIVEYFMTDWRTAKPMSPYYKGDGHVTDDTLMTNLLIDVYATHRRHLTAFDMAADLVPMMMSKLTWIPELEKETVPVLRVFLAEKWLVTRLHYGHIDPREAGVGNIVNCGAAMYMAPVGVANAGDPAGAYAEAVEIAGAHQSSYGREAAAVFAAAVAAAMAPGADVDSVLAAAVGLAKDGTRSAIEAVLAAAASISDWQTAIPVLRQAISPFDSVGEHYREPAQDSRRPSRLRAIEELPVALGLLKVTGGDVRGCILGATNYGRDSDSIATMAGAIAGALGGESAVPADWAQTVADSSRLDLRAGGQQMAAIATEIFAADQVGFDRRRSAMTSLTTLTAIDAAEQASRW